jgi:hypothetical protein
VWQPATTFEPSQPLADLALAVDARGDALAVWDRTERTDPYGAFQYLTVASYRAAGADQWEKPVTLDTSAWFGRPAVAFNGSGNATVVWNHTPETYAPGPWPLSSVRDARTGTWSTPVQIAPGPQYGVPQLGVDSAGDAVASWYGEAAYRPAGGRWQTPTRPIEATQTDLAVASDGSMVLAGVRYDGVVQVATGYRGAWSGQTVLGTSIWQYVAPAAAVASGGTAVVAWSTQEHGNNIVYSSSRVGGSWQPAVPLSFVDGNAYYPDVGIDDAGDTLGIWDATVDPESSSRPAGSSWQRPVVVAPRIASPGLTLAMNPRGEAVAVWITETTSGPHNTVTDFPIGGAYYTTAGRWQSAQALGSQGSQYLVPRAQVGIDAAGDGIAVWPHYEGVDANNNNVATLESAILDNGGPLLHAVYNHARPRITGTARVGRKLRCTRGVWTGAAPIRFRYQWLRASHAVGHRNVYRVTRRDVGQPLQCRVTATNMFGSVAATSPRVRIRR